MRTVHTVAEMRAACTRAAGRTLGLVPTMGALHEGHLSLVRAARAATDVVAVSIFVNPTQFGAGEDLGRYPRMFEEDAARLEAAGVDLLFAPGVEEMYPRGQGGTFVEVPGIGDRLDGRARPGHFRGVATVVTKLLHVVGPDSIFFGQKDAAQVAVLRAMVRDLDFAVRMVVCATVRDADGLALSSRNRYLSAEERGQALVISRNLEEVRVRAEAGVHGAGELLAVLRGGLEGAAGVRVEFAEIVDEETLEAVEDVRRGALVAVSAWVGTTRLIDNVVLPRAR